MESSETLVGIFDKYLVRIRICNAISIWRRVFWRKKTSTASASAHPLMASLLGFRGPHFSEEEAWLPGWLQQHDEKPLGELIGDTQSCFEKRIEEFRFLQENTNAGTNAILLSSKEGGYKSFQLFLSGDSSALLSSSPSTGNVVDIHLHLSADGSSQQMPSLTGETSERERPMVNQTPEASAALERENNEFNANRDAAVSIVAPTLRYQRPDNESEWKRHEATDGFSEPANICGAIELSVAASEAMVVHEVIRTMSLSKSLSSSAVLEVALQLKQARMEVWEETTRCSTEQSSEDGSLSDLDDLSMTDAYDDVGLSVADVGDLDSQSFHVSQLKGITGSGGDRRNEKSKNKENVVPEIDCRKPDVYLVNQRLENALESNIHIENDSALKSCAGERKNTFSEDPLSSDANSLASHDDLREHYQLHKDLDVSASTEKVRFAIRGEDLSQVAISSPPVNISQDAGKGYEVSSIVPDRFQSRWFGGWTWKEVKSSAPAEHNHKGIPKPFVHETSFFSESADVAPDESSVVQKQDRETILASQSSIPSQSVHTRANDEILFSQDFMKSPSLSFVDPLCSIVPCSISSENGCVTSAVNHDEVLTKGCLKPVTEIAMDNVRRASDSDNMLLNGEELAVPDSMEELHPGVHRKFTSLRTYSRLLPGQETFIEKEGFCDKSLPVGSNAKSNLFVMQTTVTHWRDEQRNCDGTAKDGAYLLVDMRKSKTSPLVLNRRTRHRLQASDVLIHEFDGDEVLKQTAKPGGDKEPPSSENKQEVQSKCSAKIVTPVPARKRVRFSETEAEISLKDKLQEQPALRTCDNRGAAKKLGQCKPPSESRALGMRRNPKHCHEHHRKRLLLQNMEFLLTEFSCQKEKEIENLIKRHGGFVLSDIPCPPTSRVKRNSRLKSKALPIVLCTKKKQTIKFLYGCAVHAHMLKVDWLTDSITAGSLLPPQQYTILQTYVGTRHSVIRKPANYDGYPSIFDGVGIMLLGKSSFCTGMAKVVKHGGGQVFKTLQCMVQSLDAKKISTGVIVAEEESSTSRHLTQCALEKNIPVLPAYWMIKSLNRGKLLPHKKKKNSAHLPPINPPDCPDSVELSMEI